MFGSNNGGQQRQQPSLAQIESQMPPLRKFVVRRFFNHELEELTVVAHESRQTTPGSLVFIAFRIIETPDGNAAVTEKVVRAFRDWFDYEEQDLPVDPSRSRFAM